MPKESPLGIGDVPYPQYSRVSSHVIKQAVAIIKGNIYTKDAEGRLIVPVTTTGVSDLTKGVFQAMADASAPSAEDTDSVQCLGAGSRIIITGAADLVVGQEVELNNDGTATTDPDKVKAATAPRNKGFIGRISEIYTKGTDGAIKQKTADNDLVVVEVEV